MVSIVHYEVYTDNGEGWRLDGRFAADQRYEAVSLAKEKEQNRIKVKIIKELFDVQDNSYQETVEYVSGLGSGSARENAAGGAGFAASEVADAPVATFSASASHYGPTPGNALLKLVLIIMVCLILVNFLVTLLTPVVETYAPAELTRPILFGIFFILFLGMTVPLLLTKVPWQAFSGAKHIQAAPVKEKKIYTKAENIIKWYNLNDENDPSIAPVFPEAPLEYKKYIVSFLTEVITQIDSATFLQDSFSKFGVKLIVYGGCMELSRFAGLRFSQANSLLYEAFNIVDGESTDLEAFYEAKRSYNDNRVAIFLTGVGAYLMASVINDKPMDITILKKSFDRWEQQNTQIVRKDETTENALSGSELMTERDVFSDCLLNILVDIEFMDLDMPGIDDADEKMRGEIRNIIYNLLRKYSGKNVIEDGKITSVQFGKLNDAVNMAIEFYRDITLYQNELNDDNAAFHNKCAIIQAQPDGSPNLSDYASGVLKQTFDDEIVTTEPLKILLDELKQSKFDFEYLGEKTIDNSGKTVALYKIIY